MAIERTRTGRVTTVVRFDTVQRTTHWVEAVLFTVVMVTAIPLYFGSLFGLTLPRHNVQLVHLFAGLALPVPIAVSLLGSWGRPMRHDARRVSEWTREEIQWLRTVGRSALRVGKFNPGQKLNSIFIAASIIILLVSGSMLQWFRFFSVELRTNATFVHDVFSFAVFVVVTGHVIMALTHREAMTSMLKGTVTRSWAESHAPEWLDEINAHERDSRPTSH